MAYVYTCTISGSREDFEKIPAVCLKLSHGDQEIWKMKGMAKYEYLTQICPHFDDEIDESDFDFKEFLLSDIAEAAEHTLAGGGPLAFEVGTNPDGCRMMEEVFNPLDEQLPGLAIFLDVSFYVGEEMEDADNEGNRHWNFISPPGQSSLKYSANDMLSRRDDWSAHPFQGCKALTCLRLPYAGTYGIWSISKSAFQGCDNLTDLILPHVVEDIDEDAFSDCPKLTIHAQWDAYEAEKFAKVHGIPFKTLDA